MDVYLEKMTISLSTKHSWAGYFIFIRSQWVTVSTTMKFSYMQNAVEFKNNVMDWYDARKTALMQEQEDPINTVSKQSKQEELLDA